MHVPPAQRGTKRGVFATRAPHRPNSIALSALRIAAVDEASGTITVCERIEKNYASATPTPQKTKAIKCDQRTGSRVSSGKVL